MELGIFLWVVTPILGWLHFFLYLKVKLIHIYFSNYPNSQWTKDWTLWGVGPATCLGLLVQLRFRGGQPIFISIYQNKAYTFNWVYRQTNLKSVMIIGERIGKLIMRENCKAFLGLDDYWSGLHIGDIGTIIFVLFTKIKVFGLIVQFI